jgi:hypothetical protein
MLSSARRAELDLLPRTHPQPGMQLKAVAVRAVAKGFTRQQVGAILSVSPNVVARGTNRTGRAEGWPWRFKPGGGGSVPGRRLGSRGIRVAIAAPFGGVANALDLTEVGPHCALVEARQNL